MNNNHTTAYVNRLYFQCLEIITFINTLKILLNRNSIYDLSLFINSTTALKNDRANCLKDVIEITSYLRRSVYHGYYIISSFKKFYSILKKLYYFKAQVLPLLLQKAISLKHTITIHGKEVSELFVEIVKSCWNSVSEITNVLELIEKGCLLDYEEQCPDITINDLDDDLFS